MPIQQTLLGGGKTPPYPTEQSYTTPGTYTWLAPANIYNNVVAVVAVGAGGTGVGYGPGGGGGGLGYKNNISVSSGTGYTVVVGATPNGEHGDGGDSYFINTSTVKGGGGSGSGNDSSGNVCSASTLDLTTCAGGPGGTYTGDGGGNGGDGGTGGHNWDNSAFRSGPPHNWDSRFYPDCGGGGAGGYSGDGGDAFDVGSSMRNLYSGYAAGGAAGSGGGGGAGSSGWDPRSSMGYSAGTGGGGVGLLGEGTSGAASSGFTNSYLRNPERGSSNEVTQAHFGQGGSGGTDGGSPTGHGYHTNTAGNYGGGMARSGTAPSGTTKTGQGAVRIIWDHSDFATSRSFPTTNTGALGDREL